MKNCIDYTLGYLKCQEYGSISRAPAVDLTPILKPWLFRSWAMDIIGEIRPSSNKWDSYVLVATDYFTKWLDAKFYKTIGQNDVINFVKAHIIYDFVYPKVLL